jgi:hypothetical protein
MLPVCQHCGQIIPPKPTIFDNSPIKKRIYSFIARHPEGVTRDQVFERVYADDRDGGPDYPNVISVHIFDMNRMLEPLGVRIHSTGGRWTRYTVKSLSGA